MNSPMKSPSSSVNSIHLSLIVFAVSVTVALSLVPTLSVASEAISPQIQKAYRENPPGISLDCFNESLKFKSEILSLLVKPNSNATLFANTAISNASMRFEFSISPALVIPHLIAPSEIQKYRFSEQEIQVQQFKNEISTGTFKGTVGELLQTERIKGFGLTCPFLEGSYFSTPKSISLDEKFNDHLIVIHPHRQYYSNRIHDSIEKLLKGSYQDNIIILEGNIDYNYESIESAANYCAQLKLERKKCLSEKFKINDYSADVDLDLNSNEFDARFQVAKAGIFDFDSKSFKKNEKLIFSGGFFTECELNSMNRAIAAFIESNIAKNLELDLISDASVDQHGNVLSLYDESDTPREGTWTNRKEMVSYFLSHFEDSADSVKIANRPKTVTFEAWIGNTKIESRTTKLGGTAPARKIVFRIDRALK